MATKANQVPDRPGSRPRSRFVDALARFWDSDIFFSFRRSPIVIVAFIVTLIFFVCAFGAAWIAPHNTFDVATLNLMDASQPPAWSEGGSRTFLLGTDDQGRDVLSTIMFGMRVSLSVGFASVAFAVVLGVTLGLIAGYTGGFVDSLIMRIADVQLSFPAILIALMIDAVMHSLLPRGMHDEVALLVLTVSIGLAQWVAFARTVRGQVMVEKNKEYVQAARVIGLPGYLIAVRHVMPNALGPVMVIATINLAVDRDRGDLRLPRRRPAADLAVARHAYHIDGNSSQGEWWMTIFPGVASLLVAFGRLWATGCDALNPEAADDRGNTVGKSPLLEGAQPARRVPDTARHAARGRRHLLRHRRRRGARRGQQVGAGKSLTGAAIIGLLEPPGRIAGGEITPDGRRIDGLPYEAMRQIRGRQIGAIFQDPLTSLNPLYRVGDQIVETIRTHLPLSEAQARKRAIELLQEVGISAAAQRIDHYPQFSGGSTRE
jgi:peptide/nickel transport system permease protein